MNRYQRKTDADGYYLATEADFHAAKALFTDKDAEELVHRLTRKEREFTDLLSKYPDGLSREQVAKALAVSVGRVSHLAYGEKGKGGLTQKLPGFVAEEITDSEILDGECRRRSTKKTLFKLSRYDPLAGFDAVVVLKDENGNGEDRDDRDDGVMKGVMIHNRDEISNGEREVERERVECDDRDEKVRELSGKENSENPPISFSLSNPGKSSHQPPNRQQETQKSIITDTRTNHHDYHTKPIDAEKESSHPTHKHKNICSENMEDKGDKGDREREERDIDSDFISKNGKESVPFDVPSDKTTGDKGAKRGLGPHPRRDEPTPATSVKIRAAAISEYGTAGWVDPAKLAHALKLPLPEVAAWLQANYEAFDRPNGGGIGYRQKRAGSPGRAEA